MPPTSDGIRTVGCTLAKLVPDAGQLDAIREAVTATHKATFLVTELLNLHIRRCLSDEAVTDLKCFFTPNWILHAYNEITTGKRDLNIPLELHETFERHMPPFSSPNRTGIQQCLLYDARNLATVASTGVWMHFHKRVLSHVRRAFALDAEAYKALTKDERRRRKLELMQMGADLCRIPTQTHQSPAMRHAWVATERSRLGIDAAVGKWKGKPLLYHLKAAPHRFVQAMALMSKEKEEAGGRAFALYPLRRSYVPRHVRVDQKALRDLLRVGSSDHIKQLAKERVQAKKRQKKDGEGSSAELNLAPLQPDGVGYESGEDAAAGPSVAPPRRKRRAKCEMESENQELFGGILDLRAAGVARRHRFDFAFTTDGVCARLQMRAKESSGTQELTSMPKRGMWAIDQLKHVSRLDHLQVVGVDPGKRELVSCVDMDDPKGCSPVRYTQRQRLRDVRSRQYADEGKRGKPQSLKDAEAALAGFNSRTSDLNAFSAYCAKRHESLDLHFAFYGALDHRRRRWKTAIKTQQSEERLYKRLEGIQKKGDSRQLVLAYGSWGMVAGRAGMACNRGNPPCIGVGLMRKLARRFVVSTTPEAYTSKTCCRCLGECGPWKEMEEKMGKKCRGLRRCTQRDCMIPLNRDRNGATNIGTNFKRLFEGKVPIRTMSEEDLAFHRASLCFD